MYYLKKNCEWNIKKLARVQGMVKIRLCVTVTLTAACVCCYKVSPRGGNPPVSPQQSIEQFRCEKTLSIKVVYSLNVITHFVHTLNDPCDFYSTVFLVHYSTIVRSVTWIRKKEYVDSCCAGFCSVQLWVQTTIHVYYVIFYPSSPKDYSMLYLQCSAILQ